MIKNGGELPYELKMILITPNGPINLSAEAPRKSNEIEALMNEKSVLDTFLLPNLD